MTDKRGPMTAHERDFVTKMRAIIPKIPLMRVLAERTGTYQWADRARVEWSLLDLTRFVEAAPSVLAPRQAQAFDLYLVQDRSEPQTAAAMGLGEGVPAAMYATDALRVLYRAVLAGEVPDPMDYRDRQEQAA